MHTTMPDHLRKLAVLRAAMQILLHRPSADSFNGFTCRRSRSCVRLPVEMDLFSEDLTSSFCPLRALLPIAQLS